jgi:glutaredoxin 3
MYYIYTKDNCGYCVSAKTLLKQKNLEYTEYKIPEDISREQVMEKFPGIRTVPVILEDEKFIGGFSELQQVLGGK